MCVFGDGVGHYSTRVNPALLYYNKRIYISSVHLNQYLFKSSINEFYYWYLNIAVL